MINSYLLKLSSGSIELPEELDREKDGKITVDFSIYDVREPDNHDGTYNRVYCAKAYGMPQVEQTDKLVCRVKSSKSKAWRWEIEGYGLDYETFMSKMLAHKDEIVEFVINL